MAKAVVGVTDNGTCTGCARVGQTRSLRDGHLSPGGLAGQITVDVAQVGITAFHHTFPVWNDTSNNSYMRLQQNSERSFEYSFMKNLFRSKRLDFFCDIIYKKGLKTIYAAFYANLYHKTGLYLTHSEVSVQSLNRTGLPVTATSDIRFPVCWWSANTSCMNAEHTFKE